MKSNTNGGRPTVKDNDALWDAFFMGLIKIGMGCFWALRMAFKLIAVPTALATMFVVNLLPKQAADKRNFPREKIAGVTVHKDFEPTVQVEPSVAVPVQSSDYMVADRIVSIRLNPPVAVLHLRVYYEQKLVKREMIVTEQRLRNLMQGRRHVFADAPYRASAGMEAIKDETVQLAQDLINTKGNMAVKPVKPVKDYKAEPAATVTPVAKVQPKAKPAMPAMPENEIKVPGVNKMVAGHASSPKPFVPRPAPGVRFEGVLSAAGTQRCTPPGRPAYETFEAKVMLDNGVEVPMRGAELERELERFNVKIGERVAITPMGKVPVTLQSGAEGSKNVYRVDRLQEVAQ